MHDLGSIVVVVVGVMSQKNGEEEEGVYFESVAMGGKGNVILGGPTE